MEEVAPVAEEEEPVPAESSLSTEGDAPKPASEDTPLN